MINLPNEFEEKMKALLGDEFEDYIKCYDEPRYYGLRVNTEKISVEDFMKICPFEITPIPWIDNGFYYDGEKISPAKHPYYFAGLYYLQEPSAMTPANRLPVEPGDRVLDVCAAPGGKATELGAKLQNEGVLVANDISSSRARGLLKNLEVFGIGNMLVMSEEPGRLERYFSGYFDKILIDAPCSVIPEQENSGYHSKELYRSFQKISTLLFPTIFQTALFRYPVETGCFPENKWHKVFLFFHDLSSQEPGKTPPPSQAF